MKCLEFVRFALWLVSLSFVHCSSGRTFHESEPSGGTSGAGGVSSLLGPSGDTSSPGAGTSNDDAGAGGLSAGSGNAATGGTGPSAGDAEVGTGNDTDGMLENGGAGGASNEAGASNAAGAKSSRGGAFGSGGITNSGGTYGGGKASGGDVGGGGGGSANSAGRSNVSGGGGASEPPKECTSNGNCADPGRPFCGAGYVCVQCLTESDCPVPSGVCIARSCALGKCTQTPKATTVGCDDGVFCNGIDHCDGAGQCASDANARCFGNATCHEDTKTCCDPTQVPVRYCGSVDEASDRAAVQQANEACGACGGYTRVYLNGCTEFHCKA